MMPHPGVRYPPPLWLVAGWLIGWLLENFVAPLRFSDSVAVVQLLHGAGILLIVLGFALAAWGVLTFVRSRTAIIPHRSASQLVETGPYRFTRNPMYTGLSAVYLGAVLAFNAVWPLVFLPLSLLALYHFVIAREERYLTDAFGTVYSSYQQRVRRWL